MAMNNIRVTKKFSFEMAHALEGHDGKCRNIHGHSYFLYVTLLGTPINDSTSSKNGMVLDFADLKVIVKQLVVDPLDHALMLFEHSEFLDTVKAHAHQKLVVKPYNPTCENMVVDFAQTIKSNLPSGIQLHSLKLEETKTSYAEWYASDNSPS